MFHEFIHCDDNTTSNTLSDQNAQLRKKPRIQASAVWWKHAMYCYSGLVPRLSSQSASGESAMGGKPRPQSFHSHATVAVHCMLSPSWSTNSVPWSTRSSTQSTKHGKWIAFLYHKFGIDSLPDLFLFLVKWAGDARLYRWLEWTLNLPDHLSGLVTQD